MNATAENTGPRSPTSRCASAVSGQRGATLIEIIITTLILSIVAIGMVEFFANGRVGLIQEDRKRVGVLLAQEALERTVAQPYALVAPWTEQRTIGSDVYSITVTMQANNPEPDMKMIQGTVSWNTSPRQTRNASLVTFVYDN